MGTAVGSSTQQWEYARLVVEPQPGKPPRFVSTTGYMGGQLGANDSLDTCLERFGNDGWRLVAPFSDSTRIHLLFERPKP